MLCLSAVSYWLKAVTYAVRLTQNMDVAVGRPKVTLISPATHEHGKVRRGKRATAKLGPWPPAPSAHAYQERILKSCAVPSESSMHAVL